MSGEDSIGSDFFDPESLEQERFLGLVVASEIRAGTIGKLVGEKVWYLEVENVSRSMTFNFSKEFLPAKGKNSLWTRQILAWRNAGIVVSEDVIPTLKGKYYWFTVRDLTYINKEKVEKTLTRNFFTPTKPATDEEVKQAIEKREASASEQPEQPPWIDEETRKGLTEDETSLILSIADGKTHEEFLKEADEYEELKPILEGLRDNTLIAQLIVAKRLFIKEKRYVVPDASAKGKPK